MTKTLGQIFHENILAKGFTEEETQSIETTMHRDTSTQTEIWCFDDYCNENNIKPTWFRFKQHQKKQAEKLKIYINSGGKDDRF